MAYSQDNLVLPPAVPIKVRPGDEAVFNGQDALARIFGWP
jgi:hypothetical protein